MFIVVLFLIVLFLYYDVNNNGRDERKLVGVYRWVRRGNLIIKRKWFVNLFLNGFK